MDPVALSGVARQPLRQAESLPLACLKLGSATSATPLDAVEATPSAVIHKFLHGRRKLARTRLLPLLLAANATTMRLVLQRVAASVTVDEEVVGEIGKGMLVLVGIHGTRRGDALVLRGNQMSRLARHRRDACSTASDSLVDRRTGRDILKATFWAGQQGGPGSIRSGV